MDRLPSSGSGETQESRSSGPSQSSSNLGPGSSHPGGQPQGFTGPPPSSDAAQVGRHSGTRSGRGNNGLSTPGPLPPTSLAAPMTGKARLQCHACNRLLEYDAGAQYVQCFSCSTMNAVQASTQVGGRVLSMLCAICHTTNLAPYGINYVRCGHCSTISQVSHAYRGTDGQPPPSVPIGSELDDPGTLLGPLTQQPSNATTGGTQSSHFSPSLQHQQAAPASKSKSQATEGCGPTIIRHGDPSVTVNVQGGISRLQHDTSHADARATKSQALINTTLASSEQ